MDFYSVLSKYYDEIFPLSASCFEFVRERVPFAGAVLDAGCATGKLIHRLQDDGVSAQGFDLDEGMLARARALDPSRKHLFSTLNLKDMNQYYADEKFDAITCLGNTLSHIPFNMQFHFLQDAISKLNPKGLLVLQILNYSHVYDEGIDFSLIETEHCLFRRHYEEGKEEGELSFVTELEDKQTGELFKNSVSHYPLLPETLMAALSMSGYAEWHTYGSYMGEQAGEGRLPLIVTAHNA